MIEFKFNDGGREAAGYKGSAGDCAARALAIVTGKPYQEVYDAINRFAKEDKSKRKKRGVTNARTGVHTYIFHRIAEFYGLKWVPTMKIGSGCKVHLRADELPKGRLIANVSKHYAAVIDGVLHDTHDCSREGTRCVYGYWYKPEGKEKETEPQFKTPIALGLLEGKIKQFKKRIEELQKEPLPFSKMSPGEIKKFNAKQIKATQARAEEIEKEIEILKNLKTESNARN